MNAGIGKTHAAVAEGYIPGQSAAVGRAMESHETLCLLNAAAVEANVHILLYFADREPLGPYRATVPAERTLHLRFNDLDNPPVPRDTDFASVIQSDQFIVVQHPRLDTRQPPHALLSTVAFGAEAR